ncbi:MAG: transketolase [Deltaproteobacteria bacterium]|nr:transketolase [Deltaproteobacteria bacterium]
MNSELSINTIRTLSIDAVQAANSGHPGAPMALAPVMYTLWQKALRYDPQNPNWFDRDRFVLSNGHASMLLYSTLYLAQVKGTVTLDDIKNFRQLNSPCAGHPEYKHAAGIECTTGPLGQGLAVSVGMAIAGAWQAKYFNKPGHDIIKHRIYSICGDGCMMEGISSEAASLAGHLKLNNLVWLYDSNHITIEGKTDLAFSDQVAKRFESYGWGVDHVSDANNIKAIEKALSKTHKHKGPSLIIVDSHIGYGAPNKQDTASAHGEPLGVDEAKAAKKFYGWPEDSSFEVPKETLEDFASGVGARGADLFADWNKRFQAYKAEYPELAKQFEQMTTGKLPESWDAKLPVFEADAKGVAGRAASSKVLNAVAKTVPWLIGGSADLAPSTKTLINDEGSFSPDNHAGRNMHFGIREHAMAAALNGMALSHNLPYGSTFFIFSDYLKPSLRLSAIMGIQAIYIFTHDSIGVGEDGPTHEPIEHLMALRAIPNMLVLRPADANEVTECWRILMHHKGPSALVLTRQSLPTLDRNKYNSASGLEKGAYVLTDTHDGIDVILIGTGSEVSLCVEAAQKLSEENIQARVVSMPSWELFAKQPEAYQNAVLPPNVKARVAVEAGSTLGWERHVGYEGAIIGMTTFGASAPGAQVFEHFGFTVDKVVEKAREQVEKNRHRV